MAILRRTRPSPVPGVALQHVKGYLSPHYGADVIEAEGGRTLVIRVPRPDPDVVNDMEAAVEHLDLPDLKEVVHCLLVGENRTLAVAPAMLRELMTRRLEYDHRQALALRRELASPWAYSLYRAHDDPRRYWRLGVRLPHAHVRDLAGEDIEAMAELLGPQLGDPNLQQAVAVYLVAGEDDVRIDPDLFLQDLRGRYDTEARAREEEAARAAAEEANRRRREEEHRALLAEMALRFKPAAPPKTPPAAEPVLEPAALDAAVDAVTEGAAALPRGLGIPLIGEEPDAPEEPTPLPVLPPPPAVEPEPESAAAPATPSPESPAHAAWAAELAERLAGAGYQVLQDPGVAGHAVDLAAERAEGYPQRVIARFLPRLTPDEASSLLSAARSLDADLALAVAPEADDEARKRFIATRAKWVAPDALARIGL